MWNPKDRLPARGSPRVRALNNNQWLNDKGTTKKCKIQVPSTTAAANTCVLKED